MEKMAVDNRNYAYDLSLFEESPAYEPQKKNNVVKIPKRKLDENRRKKLNPFTLLSTSLIAIVSLFIISSVVYSQVQLTELTEQINVATKELQEKQSIYTQLQMKIESESSLRLVENYARNELGMQKIEPTQVEYITLSSGDKAEIKGDTSNNGIFDSIGKVFSNLLS